MLGKNKMPVLFIGHGSPMNAIEDNQFTRKWAEIGKQIPKPSAILAISAHWYTQGTRISDSSNPKMIYDMYGFPDELYKVQYDAKGSPKDALSTKNLIEKDVIIDNSWGIDHGTWSVLCKMYPLADIPVYQLSVDRKATAETHYQIGQNLSDLREQGILIFASGNVVHNLTRINWDMEGGYPWAIDFDHYIKDKITKREYNDAVQYRNAGSSSELAFYTPDHYYPLLYALGASRPEDKITVINEDFTMGSLSMTSYLFE